MSGVRLRVIALDGPAASGKGTLARRLAAHFAMARLDTGLLYRAVGVVVADELENPATAEEAAAAAALNFDHAWTERPDLRDERAGRCASLVAAMPAVRSALLDYQRAFAAQPGGAVLDGRDVGTVICPDAPVKIFVTASVEARAQRRHRELAAAGDSVVYAEVLRDLAERDERDRTRSAAPLVPADDAHILDTTQMDADQAFAAALAYTAPRLG